jgi:hypothetical protein
MRRILMASLLAAASASFATSAYATTEVSAPTNVGCSTGPLAPPADYCAGYYTDNLLGGSPDDITAQQNAIQLLPGFSSFTVNWTALTNAGDIVSNGDVTALNNLLAGAGGQVLIGFHWGNVPGTYGNVSAFYLWNNVATGAIHLTNTDGWSNAVLYTATPAVPEPATWAMMLVGFAGIGAAMRRRRRDSKPALMQIA